MVLTRAARKRGSEDSEKEESLHAAASRPECIDLTDSDGEDEALSQPKTKRQRKSLRSTSAATTTRETNKGQALQQLDHNVHNKRRSRHNTVPEQSMEPSSARVVSENSTTKRAQVTKTHQNVSTRNKFSSQSTFSISLRKNKVVPIKTPATEPSVSGNNATSRLDTTTTNAHRFITRNRASKSKGTAEDIDAREQNDPQNVTDYVRDIYDHYRTLEVVYFIDQPMCRIRHPHITERMRTILVDWILEVHYKFKLNPHTLYLTVSILDRYLHKTQVPVTRRDLQLVGITSLLLAAKYEEMFVPELRDLAYICDGAYTESQILGTEERILKAIEYSLTVPSAHFFLVRFLKAANANKTVADLSSMILDSTLLTFSGLTCRYLPSLLAAAAILVARRSCGWPDWSPTLLQYSEYTEDEVKPVAKAIMQAKRTVNQDLNALTKKYSKSRYGKILDVKLATMDD